MGKKAFNSAFLAAIVIWILMKTVNAQDSPDLPVKRPEFQNLVIPYITMTGGDSTNPLPQVQSFLFLQPLPLIQQASLQILKETKQGLQYLFQTTSPFVAAITGLGSTAMEAALDNMIELGDLVFIPINGYWSRQAMELSKRLGAIVEFIVKEPGQAFSVRELKIAIKLYRPKVVFIDVGESYSGVKQDIEGIGELCQKQGCYLVVDTVAFTGIQPLYFDKLKIDVAFCNTERGIGSITGMALIVYSRRAVAMIQRRITKPTSYNHDVSVWVQKNYWLMNENTDKVQKLDYLPQVQMYALYASIQTICGEGLENVWARHKEVELYFEDQLASEVPQLKYFIRRESDRLIGTNIITVPDESKLDEILNELLTSYQIHIATGQGSPTLEKKMRVAFHGANAQKSVVDKVIAALKAVFNN